MIMSQILFFVNITMFDPREAFQMINMGFYIVPRPILGAYFGVRGEIHRGLRDLPRAAMERRLPERVQDRLPRDAVGCRGAQRLPGLGRGPQAAQHAGETSALGLGRGQDAASNARQDMPRLSELVPREPALRPNRSSFGLQAMALELSTVGSPQNVLRESRDSARLELLGVPWPPWGPRP